MKINLSTKTKALIEHYAYGVLAAAYATYSFPGKVHTAKEIAIGGLVGGLLVPILAKVNPKSLVNTITAETGAPAAIVAPAVDAAIAEANKVVAEETPKTTK
jgi:uncharacterized membrane protein YkvI